MKYKYLFPHFSENEIRIIENISDGLKEWMEKNPDKWEHNEKGNLLVSDEYLWWKE